MHVNLDQYNFILCLGSNIYCPTLETEQFFNHKELSMKICFFKGDINNTLPNENR